MNNATGIHRLDQCLPDLQENTYRSFPFGEICSEQLISVPVYSLRSDEERQAELSVENGFLCVRTAVCPQEARLLLAGRHRTKLLILKTPDQKDFFRFPLSALYDSDEGSWIHGGFRCLLEVIEDGAYHRYLLTDRAQARADEQMQKERKRSAGFSWSGLGQESVSYVSVFLNRGGVWQVDSGDKNRVFAKAVMAHLHRLAFHGSRLSLWIETDETFAVCKDVCLRFRSKLEEEQLLYQLEPARTDGRIRRYDLDLSKVPLKSLYWDPVVCFVMPDTETEFLSFLTMTYRYRFFISFFYPGQYKTPDGNLFYAYNTSSGMLAFKFRQPEACDRIGLRLKEAVAAAVFAVSKSYWKKQHIRLVYEKLCVMAQDNGYYFFRYCMDHHVEESQGARYYYVIDRSVPDYNKLLEYKKHVVPYLSLRHMIYMQAAELLVSTDTRSHLYPSRIRGSILRRVLRKKKLVFLQHGVTALKKVDFFYGKGRNGSCNLFVVTSDFEKEIVKKYFGYTEDEIVNSGFARWDVLEDHSAGRREILIMPSWRSWLENATPEAFEQSSYYRNYMELLNSPDFAAFLEAYDLHANFYLHSLFRGFLQDFSAGSDRIRLISFGEVPANELLMSCSLLVTDYSSVCWDVFYQGKPVIFFQFDREMYLEAHGSYLDMEKDLFGPDAADTKTLLTYLEQSAGSGFALGEQYARIQKNYFPVTDDQNSRRICEAIEQRWPGKNSGNREKENSHGTDR